LYIFREGISKRLDKKTARGKIILLYILSRIIKIIHVSVQIRPRVVVPTV